MTKPWWNYLNLCNQLYPIEVLPLDYKLIHLFCLKKSSKSKLKLASSAGNSFLVRCRVLSPFPSQVSQAVHFFWYGEFFLTLELPALCVARFQTWLSFDHLPPLQFIGVSHVATRILSCCMWLCYGFCNECPEAPLRSHSLAHLLPSLRWHYSSSCSHHLPRQCAFTLLDHLYLQRFVCKGALYL